MIKYLFILISFFIANLSISQNEDVLVGVNSVNSELYIELEKDSDISVFNELGNQLINKKGYKGRNFISVDQLAKGVYIIKTDNQNSRFVKY